MKKRNLLLFICLMFLALNACGTTEPVSSDFKVEFEHLVDPSNPLQVTYSTAMPSREEYGDIAVEWDLGDGTISNEDTVTHTYKEPGDYQVKLSVSSLSEKSQIASETVKTVSVQITIKNFDFTFNQSSESPLDVTFTALGTLVVGDAENDDLNYQWDFGNGVTETGKVVTKTFPDMSIHKVILTANVKGTNYNVSVEKDIDLTLHISKITFIHGPPDENGLFKTFQAIITPHVEGVYYLWDFGDGKTFVSDVNDNKTRHTYKSPCLYDVKVTAKTDESDIGKSHQEKIQVGEVIWDIDFTSTQSPNKPLEFSVEAISNTHFGETTYKWEYGFGNTATGKTAVITFDKYGTHNVTLRVYVNDVEVVTITKPIETIPAPTITGLNFTYTQDTNDYLNVNFIAEGITSNGDEIKYKWDFELGDKGEGKKISHRFNYYSTYRVTLTATIKGVDPVTYTKDVVVAPDPIVDFDCVNISGHNIDNLIYMCTAIISNNAELEDPKFEWEISDSSQGFYYTSTDRIFTVTFPVLSLYQMKLKVTDNSIVDNRTYFKNLGVLTEPIHDFEQVITERVITAVETNYQILNFTTTTIYLNKTWERINPLKVDTIVNIIHSITDESSIFINDPTNRYSVLSSVEYHGGLSFINRPPWGSATVNIRYQLKGTTIYKDKTDKFEW